MARIGGAGLCAVFLWTLVSCGLDAFYYIDYIEQGEYLDTSASIRLPSSSAEGYNTYFNKFVIFYRIYISGENLNTGMYLTDSANDRTTINTTLNSDYTYIYPFTDITSTSVSTSNLENTFFGRRYFALTLEGADIDSVLSSRSLGRTLEIAFPPNTGVRPTLRVNDVTYTLQRATSGQTLSFTPTPNRYFLNHPYLYNNANVTNELNADVAENTRSTPRYTYVSMYIAAVGTSLEMPPSTIYSQPTFIGIFQLAESN